MRYKLFLRLLAVLGMAGAMTFCTQVDDRLGEGFYPGGQQMTLGAATFGVSDDAARPFFETRLYHTDSIKASNLGYGYFGATSDATFGSRRAGFLAQYRAIALSDTENGFGYRPIFDSIQLKLYITEHTGDTLRPIRYNVYEVASNDYLNADTLYYSSFDPTPYLDPDPVFTFTFPDGVTTGPHSEYITLQPTQRGLNLVRRLMLLEEGYDMSLYKNTSNWTNYFKGLYIEPADGDEGNLFATELKGTGLLLYARNRNQSDPTLIQDTVTASYGFLADDMANTSINRIRHDYTGSAIDIAQANEQTADRPLNATVYVEGLDGVVTELTFTDALMEELQSLCAGTTDGSGLPYRSLALNQAQLQIYLEGSDYEWANIAPSVLLPQLERSAARLGMYTDYKQLTGIADYAYAYEKLNENSGFKLHYGGYLNRSLGCYEMDISGYLQNIWKDYLAAQSGETVANPTSRSIYIAPEAYGLYSMPQTVAQGMAGAANHAPIRLKLIYTLLK